MILKNLMEDKQLDLNQPFISVRRLPIAVSSSEQEEKGKIENSLIKTCSLPIYKSELKSGPIRNPGTVPFIWEQTPGRPKGEGKPQACAFQGTPAAPKLPPGRSLNVKAQSLDNDSESSLNVPSYNEFLMKHDSSKQENEDERSLDSDDDSEAYMDAHDTLSRTESSSFLNCSLSGLSGLDGSHMKPFGTFYDPQTRDFMMGRFLPAAKAMTSEPPHYTTWKQPVAREPPRQVSIVLSEDKRQSLYQHRPINSQHYVLSREAVESEEDSDDEPEYSSAKGCGLLPQICLLNPVPGLRIKGCASISSVPRAQAKSSFPGSSSKNEKKQYQNAARDQTLMCGRNQTAYLHEHKTKHKNESKSNAFRSNGQKLEGASLYRRMHGNGVSHNQYEVSREENGCIEISGISTSVMVNGTDQQGKIRKNLREILASNSSEWELGEAVPVVEKTLYIDSIHAVKSLESDSSCSDSKGNDFEILEKEGTQSVDSSLQDIKHIVDSSHDVTMDRTDVLIRRDQNLIQSSMNPTTSKKTEDVGIDSENEQPTESHSSHGSLCLHLPPPLPKSPSESWLTRTLPSISSRKQPSLGMQNYNRNQACKTPSLDPKWETIVKTSNVDHRHLRFSEELLTPIPET